MKPTKPSEKRNRLFKASRPHVRPLDIERDMWVLWAAYDLGAFPRFPRRLERAVFTQVMLQALSRPAAALIVEDKCKWFAEGVGPSALILIDNFGWRIEPFATFFRWTTPRMVLRAIVAFCQMAHHDSSVGVMVARVPKSFHQFYGRLREYGALFPAGKIPYGTPEGSEYLYYIHGKRRAKAPDVSAGVVEMVSGADDVG